MDELLYLPRGSCWRWYVADEACRLLEERNAVLVVLGDSLSRHVGQALTMLFSGNFRSGGMQFWTL